MWIQCLARRAQISDIRTNEIKVITEDLSALMANIRSVSAAAPPLSGWRQLLHLRFLHLVVHLGGFVKQPLQIAVGALERSV